MSYGYKAHYGYYIDPNGQAQGVMVDLDGKNINDCVLTDKNTIYYIPEAYRQVSPHNLVAYNSNRDSMRKRFRDEDHGGTPARSGIPDWRYFSLFPGQTSVASMTDQDYFDYAYWSMNQITLNGNYSPFTIVDQKYKGNPFRWCPNLCKKMYSDLHGKLAMTFVYLYNQRKLVDQRGKLYTVGSTGLITLASSNVVNAGSRMDFDGYSGGVTTSSVILQYVYTENNANQVHYCKLTARGGAAYEWTVFNDDDPQNAFADTFYGFTSGAYDYKSEIGKDPDPYAPGGESKPGGGGGTGVVPAPQPTPIPSVIPGIYSFVNCYIPTAQDLLELAGEIWAPNFSQLIEKTVLQPMDAIISVHQLPFDGNPGSGKVSIKLGNYTATAKAAEPIDQFPMIDCGEVTIDEIWGSYLDYKARITLFLPFIGSIPLQPDDVIGSTLNVKYCISVLTGACIAYVIRDGVVIATFGGNCSNQIPVTGADNSRLIAGIVGVAGSAITGIASGGMSAPLAAGVASSSLNVAMSKFNYQKAGGLGANTAFMGIRIPYLTIYVPDICAPADQNDFTGYPSYITDILGNQSGYTEVYSCHVSAAGASDDELKEIESLLKGGVLI